MNSSGQIVTVKPMIKFNHEEVEALLELINSIEEPLRPQEATAKEKLKKIYARQILSYEKKQEYEAAAKESADQQ